MHVFAVLGEPVRLRIVKVLASGEHSAGLLAEAVGHEMGISRTAVAYHLGVLRDADFVESRIDENRRLYRLRWNALDALDREMLDLYKIWDRRYGWPYRTDPMAEPPRRHRLTERAAQWTPLTQAEVEPRAPDDAETRFWPEADEDDF